LAKVVQVINGQVDTEALAAAAGMAAAVLIQMALQMMIKLVVEVQDLYLLKLHISIGLLMQQIEMEIIQ
jgi:hypothetical protein